jgi:hypothetical protein
MPIEHKHIGLHELKQNTIEDINAVYKKAYCTENYMQILDSLNAVTSVSILVENGSILTCCTYRDRFNFVVMENLVSSESRNGHASRFVREFLPGVSKSQGKLIIMAAEEKDLEWYRALMTFSVRDRVRVKLLDEYRRIRDENYIGETGCTWSIFYSRKTRIRYKYAFVLNTETSDTETSIINTETSNTEANRPLLPLSERLKPKSKHVSRTPTPGQKKSSSKFPVSKDY